jgi:tetratricopeptide (TPR) repeat protein
MRELTGALDRAAEGFSAVAVTAVAGMAGVGKTALAIHWAHEVAVRFPDGQLYADLHGFDPTGEAADPVEVLHRFLDALGVTPERMVDGLDARASLFRSVVAGRHLLIVLDNARDPAQVRPLLPGTPGCAVVVTSRADLSGLVATEGAHQVALDLFTADEAEYFLRSKLGSRRTGDRAAVADLVRRCVGLPLALSIVAAQAAVRPEATLAELVAELDATPDALDSFAVPDSRVDLRAVFSWSVFAASPPAQRLFRLLALHPGPDLTETAAASLAGLSREIARRLLTELVGHRLLERRSPHRFRCHDLLRAYAADLLSRTDDAGTRLNATARLLDHYLWSARRAKWLIDPSWRPQDDGEPAPEVVEAPLSDGRAALAWVRAEQQAATLLVGVGQAAGLLHSAAHLNATNGDLLEQQGRWRDVLSVRRAGVVLAERLGDPIMVAQAHRSVGIAYARQGDPRARRHLLEASERFDALGDRVGRGNCEVSLGFLDSLDGRFDDAIAHTREAARLYRDEAPARCIARAHGNLGWYHAQLGQPRQALRHCRQALARQRLVGDRHGEADTLDTVAFVLHRLCHYELAALFYQRAVDLLTTMGMRASAGEILDRLGDTLTAAGRQSDAIQAWKESVDLYAEVGRDQDAALVSRKLGIIGPPTDGAPRP